MNVDQVDVVHLAEIVGNVKVAIEDGTQVMVRKVVHPVNLLPHSEVGLAVAAAPLLLHRNIKCAVSAARDLSLSDAMI